MKAVWKNTLGLLLGALVCGVAGQSAEPSAANPDVDTIVNKANHAAYYQGNNGKSHVDMTISDQNGQERTREFIVLREDESDGGSQKYFVYFQRPADVRKMVFMVHKYPNLEKTDDRWLYLPNLDLVKRVAASDKRTSFVGSDFLYEDISGRNLAEDVHQLEKITPQHYVLKNIPKDPNSVDFSYYRIYVDKETFLPMNIEYYDKTANQRLYRQIKAEKVEQIAATEEGKPVVYPTVTKSVASDYNSGSTTTMVFSNIKYNIDLPNIFTERYLKRPPREAMR
ncbi:MAG: outer membrane lipoprotein-sorting protein [Chlamydiota bacterium]